MTVKRREQEERVEPLEDYGGLHNTWPSLFAKVDVSTKFYVGYLLGVTLINHIYFLKDFIYLRKREHEQGGGAEREGEADSPLSREPNVGLIPGPQEHDLSLRQTPNQMSHPDTPNLLFL